MSVEENLLDISHGWNVEKTREFNKGFDWGYDRNAWVTYPPVNVALEAGDKSWINWLKPRCEALGIANSQRGLPVFDQKVKNVDYSEANVTRGSWSLRSGVD
jgi:hypothetical protein